MASYTRDQVNSANLPVGEMIARLDPKTHRGDKARFFNHVVRFASAAAGKVLTEAEIDSRASNLAHNFTRFAGNHQDTLPLGTDVSLADVQTAWSALKNGNLDLGSKPNGNGNGANGNTATSGNSPKTGTETRREAEAADVPPVTQNVFASALKVFEGLRTRDDAFPIPSSSDDAYELLWDHLAEPVKAGRASGVISDTLATLATNNRDLFNGIITVLPDAVKDALEEALIDRAYDTYKVSLKNTVENVYHISIGKKYASAMFAAWRSEVERVALWLGRDEPDGWKPSEEQVREANRDHAVATFRALVRGLRTEVAQAQPEIQVQALQPIQFNTIMGRLLAKGPEHLATIGGRWGNMSVQDQHAFVAALDKEEAEDQAQAQTETPAAETQAEAPAQVEAEAQAPAQNRQRRNA